METRFARRADLPAFVAGSKRFCAVGVSRTSCRNSAISCSSRTVGSPADTARGAAIVVVIVNTVIVETTCQKR